MSTATSTSPPPGGLRSRLLVPLTIASVIALPAIVLRTSGTHPEPILSLLLYGGAVVAASFLLAWAAEAVQVDISGGLAIALLAFIAVLPEYAVDLYFAYSAGSDEKYVHYAAANLIGANQLVLGLGWPLVAFVSFRALAKKRGTKVRTLLLDPRRRVELAFLGVAGVLAFVMPLAEEIHLALALVLLGLFGLYLRQVARQDVTEPELIGTPQKMAELPTKPRRRLLASIFVFAAVVIVCAAEPFAHALIDTGVELGIDEVLLVQWLAPLASEAPEFIVAILLARRGNADDALGALLSSKVNQWTLLVGSIPLAYLAGGGGTALPLDPRQVSEFWLTATQTALGFAVLIKLRFHFLSALTIFVLFCVQFFDQNTTAHHVVSVIYAVLAVFVLIRDRRAIPSLALPFVHWARPARAVRKVFVTTTGALLLGLGAVLLVAPGPGLIVIALGLIVLGTEYEWARHRGRTTLTKAQQAADAAAARPAALAGSAAFAIGMVVLGVILCVTDDLPGSGIATGASVIFSGLVILATLTWSVRGRRRRETEDAEELSSAL
jgi:cation:H+ antiporter